MRTPPRMMRHPTALLTHPFSSAEPSAFTRQRQKRAKVHQPNVSTSAKTWVLCVQEWFLSSRDRLKKSRVLARATCECSSRAQRASHSPTARVLCTMHSATLQPALIKGRPAWSPSMLLVAAVAAAAVALPLSSMWQQQSSLLPRKQARPLPQPPHTGGNAGARQALRRSLCGALSAHSALLLHLRCTTSPCAAGAHLAERRQQLPARCALTRAAVSRRRKAQELEQGSKESRWNSMATPRACGL